MLLLNYFALTVLLILFIQAPTFKKIIGESLISQDINRKLSKKEYHLFKDVALPALGDKTQIEEIIVSRYGIFVIETKYMKGWIYGGEKPNEWTQKLPGRQFTFPNPLHQNTKHIRALAHMLNISDDMFHSLIVFTAKCTFESTMPNNVTNKGHIKYIKSKDKAVLTKAEVDEYVNKIKRLKIERSDSIETKQIAYLRQPYRT